MEQMLIPIWPESAAVLGIGRTKTFELIAAPDIITACVELFEAMFAEAPDEDEPEPGTGNVAS